jgi:hypothetical protein
VEKAPIEQRIEYERVPGPGMPWQRKQRTRLFELTGDYLYPAIEFDDGTVYREESTRMATTIRTGELFDHATGSNANHGSPGATPTTGA